MMRMSNFVAGRSEDGERPHQPEGSRSGWISGPVQDQEAHSAQQTHEGVLRKTGKLSPLYTEIHLVSFQVKRNQGVFFVVFNFRLCITTAGFSFDFELLFCLSQGLSIRQIRFRFDGQPINETDTPAQLEMEDEDTIDVFQQQTGGVY
uniref:Small ubiquitin-related modifier 3 n=1 Tax=Xiphophorus maculatus TaxID=8083 RepID=M4ALP8_XIPMA